MDRSHNEGITALFERIAAGETGVDERVAELLYANLRNIARHMMRTERPNHTLQPTALANEAWLKLARGQQQKYENREHFFRIAASAMRQVLLDHARSRLAQRRKPDAQALDRLKEDAVSRDHLLEIVALDEALNRLAERDHRLAKIVELRCFADLSVEETAHTLGLSPTTVKREWRIARTLLLQYLNENSGK